MKFLSAGDFLFHSIVVRENILYDTNSLKLLRLILWSDNYLCVSCALEKNVILLLLGGVFYRYQLGLVNYSVVQVYYFLANLPVSCSIHY